MKENSAKRGGDGTSTWAKGMQEQKPEDMIPPQLRRALSIFHREVKIFNRHGKSKQVHEAERLTLAFHPMQESDASR